MKIFGLVLLVLSLSQAAHAAIQWPFSATILSRLEGAAAKAQYDRMTGPEINMSKPNHRDYFIDSFEDARGCEVRVAIECEDVPSNPKADVCETAQWINDC